jgi:hypothetical protein
LRASPHHRCVGRIVRIRRGGRPGYVIDSGGRRIGGMTEAKRMAELMSRDVNLLIPRETIRRRYPARGWQTRVRAASPPEVKGTVDRDDSRLASRSRRGETRVTGVRLASEPHEIEVLHIQDGGACHGRRRRHGDARGSIPVGTRTSGPALTHPSMMSVSELGFAPVVDDAVASAIEGRARSTSSSSPVPASPSAAIALQLAISRRTRARSAMMRAWSST